ncbi:hypothetical protein [Sphingomonas changbaiensis]|nr:hypothetical protein [Sphingomonas changbaiensis]
MAALVEPVFWLVLLLAAAITTYFWSAKKSDRSFWAEMACSGYLFPKHLEDGSVVKRDLEGPDEQKAAFSEAARRIGFNKEKSRVAGTSASVLCNQPNKAK